MDSFRGFLRWLGVLRSPTRVVVLGLDNSGKTTLIQFLMPSRAAGQEVTPTIAFQRETFARGNFTFDVWDMSGAGAYRSLWETYYREADAVIFVLDASDRLRLCVARDELETVLKDASLVKNKAPFLFLANKSDLPKATKPSDVAEDLGLAENMKDRTWQISATNALNGDGVDDAMSWLVSALNTRATNAKAK